MARLVTNGGVASTVQDAAVRDHEVTLLSDGCAAFAGATLATATPAPRSVALIATIAETLGALAGRDLR